jgi:hypothetical protein
MGKSTQKKLEKEPIAFDDALRRLVNTPPKHKPGKPTNAKPDAKRRENKD